MGVGDEFDLSGMLSHLLRRAHFSAEAKFAETLGRHGVTSRQMALLVAIAQKPDASQNQLGHMIALDQNTMSDMTARMLRKKLIEREPAKQDKRLKVLSLTDRGKEILEAAAREDPAYQESFTQRLSGEEKQQLIGLLQRMLGVGGSQNESR